MRAMVLLPPIFIICFLPARTLAASIHNHNPTGTFWQLTDIHWDRNYSRTGNSQSWCHPTATPSTPVLPDNGYFGNYSCDPPLALVRSAVKFMAHVEAKPDFILWTGDNAPHWDDGPLFDYIYSALRTVTGLLVEAFGANVTILPCLGNHDAYPSNQFPGENSATSSDFYRQYLSAGGWDKLLTKQQQETFLRGGYYVHELPKHNLQVIVLNTNIYYQPNTDVSPLRQPDPAGQLHWLNRQLTRARSRAQKVVIAGHIAPGFFERYPAELYLHREYNDAFLHVLNANYDVIHSQVYGHSHTDSFRLLTENIHGMWQIRSAAMVAPSLTPWVPQAGTNPGVRLYRYTSRVPLEYKQYILNLTIANQQHLLTPSYPHSTYTPPAPSYPLSADTLPDPLSLSAWRLLYSTADDYALTDLSVNNMAGLLQRMMTSQSLFAVYFRYNTGAYAANTSEAQCSALCRRRQLCAIVCLNEAQLSKCLSNEYDEPVDAVIARRLVFPVATRWRDSSVTSLFPSLAVVVALVMSAVVVVTWHRWRRLAVSLQTKQTFDFQQCQYTRLATG